MIQSKKDTIQAYCRENLISLNVMLHFLHKFQMILILNNNSVQEYL